MEETDISSRIEGQFSGWHGETTYRLKNGECWQQALTTATFFEVWEPMVRIYRNGSSTMMAVKGTPCVPMPVRRVLPSA